ncbi:MAG: DtxR family transcriptional regulator [Ignavibacteriaceae bacterium]|nr:DtxR family transcriptional regulator [Ignavibacteriaceae bacterium]
MLGISKALRGQQRRRLMDLGVVPGTEIFAEMRGAFGDPTAYRIKGASIALRKKLADRIYLISEKEGLN